MQRRQNLCAWLMVCLLMLGWGSLSQAQVNTATLSGVVRDPQGLGVAGAKVTLTSAATGAQRNVVTDDNGRYSLVGLVPGQYKMTVDGGGTSRRS